MIELFKHRDALSEEIGVIENTKKGKGYEYTPFDDIWQKVRPLLVANGLYIVFSESGSETVTVTTTLFYIDEDGMTKTLATSPSMAFYSIAGMSTLHSRIAISTILKRIGLIEVLNLSFKDEEARADTVLTEKKGLSNDGEEWKSIIKSLKLGEVDLDTILNMYEVTPTQKAVLSGYAMQGRVQ